MSVRMSILIFKSQFMANTYSQLYVQIVFAVKGRENLIKEEMREEVQKYISGILREKNQKLLSIYCMPDHVHILTGIKPDISISDLVRDIKTNSSSFIKTKSKLNFHWQTGFGAFSYSKSQIRTVADYIDSQPLHHKNKSFRDEYLELLKEFEINYDEKYVFEMFD